MAKSKPDPTSTSPPTPQAGPPAEYTVVARRYRPQQFAELIGQEHVAAALVNALQSGRVAHAYLFTGARGVGKTSAARILAKALNCVEGPTPTPCDRCESCKAVAAGEDVDVLEIDGASNNKVEEIRDLRQNVGFRPTRSRYKIYIIDEVHMLSTSAFNALLKTLEEPPPHVKFIFATTEVQKIPITILSRCQRFDFAHVGPGKIFEQLKAIVAREKHQADDDALRLLARRAGGSMRDSQSLLDQLLASCPGKLTTEQVNAVLGSAGDERVTELAAAILAHDSKTALNLIAGWVERGLQIGELVDQLVGYWRSLMLVNCGGPDVRELPVTPSQKEAVVGQAAKVSLDAILAGLEVWTNTRARLRDTNHSQVLLEMAVVRLCRMDELLSIGQLVQTLSQPGAVIASAAPPSGRQVAAPPEATPGAKKNGQLPSERVSGGLSGQSAEGRANGHLAGQLGGHQGGQTQSEELSTLPLTPENVEEVWRRLIRYLCEKSPILGNQLKSASLPAIFGPNALAIPFSPGYTHAYEACATEANTQRIQDALRKLTGHPVVVRLEKGTGRPTALAGGSAQANDTPPTKAAGGYTKQRLMTLPFFKKAGEVLGAEIRNIDDDFDPTAPPRAPATRNPEADPDEV